ncbi:MAG: imidazole glycerol phosphate synthase subunit HisH [Bacteroidetes bacterium]|nr:imidazole glycerol phosphate synthase subunit HisH [Bacteroidota bacterium]
MKLSIINYGSGNIQSIKFALERLGVHAQITENAEEIIAADKVIFPGVGEASFAMKQLHEKNLVNVIRSLKQPVLGICLGMQLLCEHSEEGNTDGIGIFKTQVKKFSHSLWTKSKDELPAGVYEVRDMKIPQIGWNTITGLKGKLFAGIPENAFVYYVHGYYAENSENNSATSDYILSYAAAVSKENFNAVQFHPEKSGAAGEKILRNFIEL